MSKKIETVTKQGNCKQGLKISSHSEPSGDETIDKVIQETKEFVRYYQNALNSTQASDTEIILNVCQEYIKVAGEPFSENTHGFKNTYKPHIYFLCLIIKHFFNYTYNKVANEIREYIGICPHPSVILRMLKSKANFIKRYCDNFLKHIKAQIKSILRPYVISEEEILIGDSTGISSRHKSLKRIVTTIEDRKKKAIKNFDKLHLVASYRPWIFSNLKDEKETLGFTLIEGAYFAGPYSSDSEYGCRIVTEFVRVPRGRYFLADSAYETINFLKKLFKRGYIPCICPEKTRAKNKVIKKARRKFRKKLYKFRGIIEQPFGWLTNGGDNIVREKLPTTRGLAIYSKILKILVRQLIALRIAKDKISQKE